MLPEKIRLLNVSIGDTDNAGQLIRASTYEFRYLQTDTQQTSVVLLMPPAQQLTWQDCDLFSPMDQNPAQRRFVHEDSRTIPEAVHDAHSH